jgi:hypothetical protein
MRSHFYATRPFILRVNFPEKFSFIAHIVWVTDSAVKWTTNKKNKPQIHTYIHPPTHARAHTRTHTHIHACRDKRNTYVHAYIRTHAHLCIHVRANTHTRARAYTHTARDTDQPFPVCRDMSRKFPNLYFLPFCNLSACRGNIWHAYSGKTCRELKVLDLPIC